MPFQMTTSRASDAEDSFGMLVANLMREVAKERRDALHIEILSAISKAKE